MSFKQMLREFSEGSAKLTACMDDLLRAAQVINHKLHRKPPGHDEPDADIDEESKNTRRNSQYKSMALNLMWYFAYKHVNGGRDPPAPSGRGGDKCCDNEKKDHYTKFNTADYTFDMVVALKRNMPALVAFAYDEYCRHLQAYMQDHINAKRVTAADDQDALRARSKRPHILSKLYCAMLLETDHEELFRAILHKLRTKYCKYQVNRLLQAAVDHVCVRYLPPHERSVHVEKLKNSLKSEQLQTVALRLLDWGRRLKYAAFPMVDSVQDDDISLLDVKKFETHRRNTETIHYYASPVPLALKVENYDRKYSGGVVVLVEFSCPARHTKFIYDCLSHPQHAKETLAALSWKQRLDLVLDVSSEINVPTITVEEISVEQLQFERYPGGHNNYHYIRTGGFGCGTSFVRSVPGQRKRSARQSSVLNKRHKKVKLEDLDETEVHAGPVDSHQTQPGVQLQQHQQQQQQQQQQVAYQQAAVAAAAAAVYHQYPYFGYMPMPPHAHVLAPPMRSPSPPESLFSLDMRHLQHHYSPPPPPLLPLAVQPQHQAHHLLLPPTRPDSPADSLLATDDLNDALQVVLHEDSPPPPPPPPTPPCSPQQPPRDGIVLSGGGCGGGSTLSGRSEIVYDI